MSESTNDRTWLTPDEAAEYLAVSRRKLLRLIELKPARLGHRTVRYDRRDLEQYMLRMKDAA